MSQEKHYMTHGQAGLYLIGIAATFAWLMNVHIASQSFAEAKVQEAKDSTLVIATALGLGIEIKDGKMSIEVPDGMKTLSQMGEDLERMGIDLERMGGDLERMGGDFEQMRNDLEEIKSSLRGAPWAQSP